MSTEKLRDTVKAEIERFHDFLSAWFRGEGDSSDARFNEACATIDENMVNIQPNGTVGTVAGIFGGIKAAFGSNPDFNIRISDVTVRYTDDQGKLVLATYIEHQSGAKNTTPSKNSRFSTALFRIDSPDALPTWLHLHETGLPSTDS